MQLLIGGDLAPTDSNKELFSDGDVNTLLGEELLSIWNNADIRILNLETPLTDKISPIAKYGPNLFAPTSTVVGIKALHPTLLALANNHILDQGVQGLKSTIQVLSENGIPFVGIGDNLFEASRPYILEHGGMKIGIYACAEHEFTIATDTTAGANPFDPLESLDHIQDLKAKCDYVIVLYHGGKEHYRYPSPYLQRVCRKIVEKGADLVVCQHSHCIGCYEVFKDSYIVYGQGNFLFDRSESEYWQTSLLIRLSLGIGTKFIVDFIPIIKKGNCVRLASGSVKSQILSDFEKRSSEIKIKGFIENQFQKFALSIGKSYLSKLAGYGRIRNAIERMLFRYAFVRIKYNNRKMLMIKNYIECEAHRELLIKYLDNNQENY